jgi:hypothetical protein
MNKNAKPSHDWEQESDRAKARWFQSLTREERMDYLCAITDLILENNPGIADVKRHAQPASQSVRVLRAPRS